MEVSDGDARLNSRITQTANEIRSEVTASEAGLSSRITQNANKVAIVVDDNNNLKTAAIVAGINDQSGSYVKISADTIDLSGYVTASQLSATNAAIDNIISGNTTINRCITGALYANSSFTCLQHGVYWQGVTINGVSYHLLGYVG
jgi:hypothetical protein